MSPFTLARRVAEKRIDDIAKAHAHQPDAADTGLPFGARIGGLIELPLADFALLEGSLMRAPATSQLPIVSASRLVIDADPDLLLYRLYTDVGVDRAGQGAYLQVLVSKAAPQDVRDIAFYQYLFREYPTDAREQEAFLGSGFGLGQSHYDMGRDELAQVPHLVGRVDSLLGDAQALGYDRDAPGGDYIRPWTAVERRIDDAIGEKGVEKNLHFMQYVRTLPSSLGASRIAHERLQISFEETTSKDGMAKSAVWVDYFAGIQIDPARLKAF